MKLFHFFILLDTVVRVYVCDLLVAVRACLDAGTGFSGPRLGVFLK